jgi:hypothetical protein
VKEANPPGLVHRIGRWPNPWAWPDWSYAGADGTFGNRYDDPEGHYRVLYASSERVATFVETLARFRPDPAVVAGLEEIEAEPGDERPSVAGTVPREWLEHRAIGSGQLTGRYVEIGATETLSDLRTALAPRLVHYQLEDLDAAAIRMRVPRRFTQEISRHVFVQGDRGERRWDGIAYLSRLGDDLHNWALFEPHEPTEALSSPIAPDDADLARALDILGLQMGAG